MELNVSVDKNGLTRMPVTSKHLDDFLLWRINTGILYRDGLRLVYDRMPDGSVQLALLAVPDPSAAKFEYSERAESEARNAWDEFIHSVR